MKKGRREFIKAAGLAAIGIATDKCLGISTVRVEPAKIKDAGTIPGKLSSSPVKKERLAMVLDLRKCLSQKGCTKCIDVCNNEHNIPQFNNPKDEIKWIWKEPYQNTFVDQENFYMTDKYEGQMVPVFCNNCDNPPCVNVCPTQATWKREDGIVMMDWHRCIGCRYCMAACPYGSRSFNWRDPRPAIKEINPEFPTRTKGVVEKCMLCEERLAKGLQPACVEACTEKALIFGDLSDPESEVRKLLKENFSIRRKPGLGTGPEIYYLV
jgi:Fe-S-cluster-containing dehydrogenase component